MTNSRTLSFERETLSDLQDLMWTAGYVVDAIRNTQGVETIEQTIMRPMDGDSTTTLSSFAVVVRPKSDMSVYRLGRILADKIEAAKNAHFDAYEKFWPAYVYTGDLNFEFNREHNIGAIRRDVYGRDEIVIRITLHSK